MPVFSGVKIIELTWIKLQINLELNKIHASFEASGQSSPKYDSSM